MVTAFKIGTWCLIFLICFAACNDPAKLSSKEEIQTEMTGTRALVNTNFEKDGCEVLLEIEEDGEKVLLMPVFMENSFKVNGAVLEIVFHSSRIMQSKCQIGRPIVLDSIKLIDQNR